MSDAKVCLSSERIPPAVGPYSQAVRCGNMLFCSGIIGVDPETGGVVEGGIQAQTRRVLDNLSMLLEDCGTNLSNVLKTTVFLKHMDDFKQLNATYAEYFTENAPARSTCEVGKLPLDVLVEIEAIAVIDE